MTPYLEFRRRTGNTPYTCKSLFGAHYRKPMRHRATPRSSHPSRRTKSDRILASQCPPESYPRRRRNTVHETCASKGSQMPSSLQCPATIHTFHKQWRDFLLRYQSEPSRARSRQLLLGRKCQRVPTARPEKEPDPRTKAPLHLHFHLDNTPQADKDVCPRCSCKNPPLASASCHDIHLRRRTRLDGICP